MKKLCLVGLFSLAACVALADYPIFSQRYTADPWCIEHEGRLYMYCSHDTFDAQRGYGYYMNDITLISTTDLKNWTDHGEVFSHTNVAWGASLTWAPCVVERNGKFYLYYGNGGNAIGVAVSDSPTGPFRDTRDKPLISRDLPGVERAADGSPLAAKKETPGALPGAENWGMWVFDPGVFVDDDGKAYLYFGGSHPDNSRMVELKENMVELAGPITKPNTPGFFEASAVHKHNGKYYYSYSSHGTKIPCTIDYVTADSPTGPFSNARTAMDQPPANDGMNHHQCIFTYKGQSYMAYHNRTLAYMNGEADPRGREYQRSVALDRLDYDAEGNIIPVIATRDGLPQLHLVDPYATNEARTMARSRYLDVRDGRAVALHDGATFTVRGVDFKKGARRLFVKGSCSNPGGAVVEVRLESEEGLRAGAVLLAQSDEAKTVDAPVDIRPGVYDVTFVLLAPDTTLSLDTWRFSE